MENFPKLSENFSTHNSNRRPLTPPLHHKTIIRLFRRWSPSWGAVQMTLVTVTSDQYLLPAGGPAANQPHAAAVVDRENARTLDHYIDPAVYTITMPAVSKSTSPQRAG